MECYIPRDTESFWKQSTATSTLKTIKNNWTFNEDKKTDTTVTNNPLDKITPKLCLIQVLLHLFIFYHTQKYVQLTTTHQFLNPDCKQVPILQFDLCLHYNKNI